MGLLLCQISPFVQVLVSGCDFAYTDDLTYVCEHTRIKFKIYQERKTDWLGPRKISVVKIFPL